MKKGTPAGSPDEYVGSLTGWQRPLVEGLREAVLGSGELEERIKWGHLVYLHRGPVLYIRAEENRVLFGFWRGQRLRDIEPGLKPGGKYEMASVTLDDTSVIDPGQVSALVRAAIELNDRLGDPTRG